LIERRSIVEIIKPAENGMTTPYLCELDNGHRYYVKGSQATGAGLISETIAGTLGRAFKLPIPEFCLADAPHDLLALHGEARLALGSGCCFASRAQDSLIEIPFSAIGALGRPFHQRLFLFDYWIANGDRTLTENGGNPNLFTRLADGMPVVIDHNLAFASDFTVDEIRNDHVSASFWFNPTVDLLFRDEVSHDMEVALAAVANVESDLPDEWLERAPALIAAAMQRLEGFRSAQFWDNLK
jgi:hypothetical protein